MFYNYDVKGDDIFAGRLYPDVVKELDGLGRGFAGMHGDHKADIVISFLKDHSIRSEWLGTNTALVRSLTSGSPGAPHLEALFISCKGNPTFLKGLEDYIKHRIV
jgi:hypothetical protein